MTKKRYNKIILSKLEHLANNNHKPIYGSHQCKNLFIYLMSDNFF